MGNGGSSCHAAGSCTVISTALSSALYSSTHRCVNHRSSHHNHHNDDDDVLHSPPLHYDTSPTRSSSVSRSSTASAPAATGTGNTHRSPRRRRRHRHKTSSSSSQPVTVLLLDGRTIQFRHKVTAMQVLIHHQNHCLCPAQSLDEAGANAGAAAAAAAATQLRSTSHAANSVSALFKPISLLPHDHLHPGRVYILIPVPTFELFAAAAHAAKKGTISPNYCKKLPLEVPSANGSSKRRHLTITKSSSGAAPAKCLTRTRSFDLPSPTSAARSAAAAIMQHNRSYSGSIRRCSSWTPRLQAIHEV